MKKLFTLLLAGVMMLSLAACGSKKEETPAAPSAPAASAPAASAPAAATGPTEAAAEYRKKANEFLEQYEYPCYLRRPGRRQDADRGGRRLLQGPGRGRQRRRR